ncbi:MAG: hypothetical protein Fur0010_24480 [Bdellovibrio sp.]
MKCLYSFQDGEFISRELIMSSLSDEVYQLLMVLSREGFQSLLIGGAVRDFVLTGKFSKDIDIELRHPFDHTEEEWAKLLTHLSRRLRDQYHYQVEELNFSVFRIHLNEVTVECASPRLEFYDGDGPWGHSEFRHQIGPKIPFEEAIHRRDFTINTMGIEHCTLGTDEEFKWRDPLRALLDFESGELKAASDNFNKDPVRILRAIRFSRRFNLELCPELLKKIAASNLSKLTPYYVESEAIKTGPFHFFSALFELIDEFHISIPDFMKDLRFLTQLDSYHEKPNSLLEYFYDLLLKTNVLISEEVLEKFVSHFQFKSKLSKDAYQFLSFRLSSNPDEKKSVLIPVLKGHLLTQLELKQENELVQKLRLAKQDLRATQAKWKQDFKQYEEKFIEKTFQKFFEQ